MAELNVLVTCGGGFQGQAVISGLRAAPGLRISMADQAAINASRYLVDRFHPVPAVDPPEPFLEALRRICRDDEIHLVIPATDIELAVLAEHRDALGAWVAVSEPALLAELRQKDRLHRWLCARGFPVLPRIDLDDAAIAFPILGKPLSGWGGRGHRVVRSAAELEALGPDRRAGYLWQPLLGSFVEYSVDGAIGDDQRLSPWVARRRQRTSGGVATVSDLALDQDVAELAAGLAEALRDGGRGLFNLQLLRTGAGLVVSDLNPRVGTSAVFSQGAGVNLPLFLCSCLRPELAGVLSAPARAPLRMVRHLSETWIEEPESVDVDGIVFDLDDTLLDHKHWILSKLELVLDDVQAALRILEEGNRSHLFDALAEELQLSPATRDQLIARYRAVEPSEARLFPEVRVVLEDLAASGYRIALVTDNPPASQRAKLRLAGLEPLFDAVVYTRELGAEKPDPSGFRAAADQLGLAPERLASVGDNPYRDAVGALAAGYRCAFWLSRPGTFINADPAIVSRRLSAHRIADLRQLSWYLA